MQKAFFSGIIHPERALLNCEGVTITTDIHARSGERLGTISFSVILNQVSGVINNIKEGLDLYTIRNYLVQTVATFVNCIAFSKGYVYTVEIVKLQSAESDFTYVYGVDVPYLENRNLTKELTDIVELFNSCTGTDGIYLKRAISDCVMAMRVPEDTGFYCYRALESIKQWFGTQFNLSKDKEQWMKMAEELRGTQEDVKLIQHYAFPARHGIPLDVEDETRIEIFEKTWTVIERFIAYRKKSV
jgi:vacuolar-type H+-ATPase subunit D/Vma8